MAFLHAVSGDTTGSWASFTNCNSGLLGFVVYGVAITAVDADIPIDPKGTVDWIGSYLGVAALILFNFVWKYVVLSCHKPRS